MCGDDGRHVEGPQVAEGRQQRVHEVFVRDVREEAFAGYLKDWVQNLDSAFGDNGQLTQQSPRLTSPGMDEPNRNEAKDWATFAGFLLWGPKSTAGTALAVS